MIESFKNGGKLLVAGNGGSCADSDHITGELLKSFCKKRTPSSDFINQIKAIDAETGAYLADKLQGSLPAIALTNITIGAGHLGHIIKEFFGDGSKFGVTISYFTEDRPLGTAGALFKMLDGKACDEIQTKTVIDEDFLLLCGDVIFDIDFKRFISFHKEHKAWASLMAHPNGHPYDSSLLVTETLPPQEMGGMPVNTHRVTKWMAKEDERLYYKNLVNAGVQIISPELLRETMKNFVPRHPETPDKIDLDRDVFKQITCLCKT